MAPINERVLDVILGRLRAGEPIWSVMDDYWNRPYFNGVSYIVHESDLISMIQRLASLETWTRDVLSNAEAEYHRPNKPTRSVPTVILDRCPVQPANKETTE